MPRRVKLLDAADSNTEVDKVSQELTECRSRLEAAVEDNKRNREVVQGLSDQVQKFRQRAAEKDAMIAGSRLSHHRSLSRLEQPTSSAIGGSPYITGRDSEASMLDESQPFRTSPFHRSSPLLNRTFDDRHSETININIDPSLFSMNHPVDIGDMRDMEALFNKLKTELFKNNTLEEINEMLKAENDAALAANLNLRGDVGELTRTLELLSREHSDEQERFKIENTRYRNYLDVQHKQLISLWKAFLAIKKQMRELKTSTAMDLEKQMTEFSRCASLMQRAVRQAECRVNIMQSEQNREKDGVYEEILQKYEEVAARNLQIEQHHSDKARQLMKLESTLRKEREEKETAVQTLVKICQMPELNTTNTRQRARSASPGAIVNHSDAIRKIRSALSAKTQEIRDIQMRMERAESETERYKRDIERVERDQRSRDEEKRQRADEQRKKEIDSSEFERQLKRMEERVQTAESEKEKLVQNIQSLQESVAQIHKSHTEFIESLTTRHKEELDTRQQHLESDAQSKIDEEKTRGNKMREELDKVRTDFDRVRTQLRDVQAELQSTKKQSDERENGFTQLEEGLLRLKKELTETKDEFDNKDKEIQELKSKLEHSKEKQRKAKEELTGSNGVNSILQDENRSLQDQSAELREQINELMSKVDQAEHTEEEFQRTIDQLNANIEAQDKSIKELKGAFGEMQNKADIVSEELNNTREQFVYTKGVLEQKMEEIGGLMKEREEIMREKENVGDEVTTLNHEIATLNAKCGKLEKEITDRTESEHHLKIILDELRATGDKAQRELAEKDAIIEDIKDKMEELHSELVKREEKLKTEMARVQESRDVDLQSEREEWKGKMRGLEADKDHLKQSLTEENNRSKELTAKMDELQKKMLEMEMEAAEWKDKFESQEKKLKREVENLTEQNNADRDAWEERREQEEKSKTTLIQEMTFELKRVETNYQGALDKESDLKRDMDDLKEQLEEERRRVDSLKEELEKQSVAMIQSEQDHQNERRQLTTQQPQHVYIEHVTHHIQVEETQYRYAKIQSDSEEMTRKYNVLERDLERLEGVVTNKNQQIQDYERQLDELTERVRDGEKRENDMRDEIALMEREISDLRNSRERKETQLAESQQRTNELENKVRDLQKEVHMNKLQLETTNEDMLDKEESTHALNNKVQQLELQLADKTAKLETTMELLKKLENTQKTMVTEMKEESERLQHYRRQVEELKQTNSKLKEDLGTTRHALEKKTSTNRTAMADLLDNYREAEKQSMERQSENEHLKVQMNTLTAKLDRVDRKNADLESRLEDSDVRCHQLSLRLNQYERSATTTLQMNKDRLSALRPGVSSVDLSHNDHYSSYASGLGSLGNVRNTSSSHDLSLASPDRSVHFDDSHSKLPGLNVSASMDITLRYLKERIEQLEKDKAALQGQLSEVKQSEKKQHSRVEETTGIVDRLERRVNELNNDNKILETRLSSQRQVYLSNEEAMRSRDNEFRNLKAKLVSADLHQREKDSKINQLTAQLETLKADLADATADKQKYSTMCASLDLEAKNIDEERAQLDDERNRLSSQLKSVQQELQNTTKRMEETEAAMETQRKTIAELKREETKRKETIERLQSDERHWKQTAAAARKSSEDYHKTFYEERVMNMQHNYDTLNAKFEQKQLENEKLRQELRDSLQRVAQCNSKINELEQRLQEAIQERKTVGLQLQTMQKLETEWTRLEREMRDELKQLRKDKLTLTNDNEELKRRLLKCDLERKEVEAVRARLDREVVALKKHVEGLEDEKSRTEDAVRNTLNERKAMDRSLAAMERENTELYKNCSQLQTQIQQLERDTGTRSVHKILKEQAELEGRLSKVMQEKRQLEMVLDQKEMNFAHKRKLLESQLSLLKDQLDAERKRRMEMKREPRLLSSESRSLQQNYSSYHRSMNRNKSPFK